VTLSGVALIASARRNVTLMPLVFILAATAGAWLWSARSDRSPRA
jgi:hypothetical protein